MTPRTRASAQELVNLTLDPASYVSWDSPLEQPDLGEEYSRELAMARAQTGVDESVRTGEGKVDGRRVALIIGEFGFLAGSIGTGAADRIVDALRRATAEGLAVLAAPVSGGTRMQEGTIAFTRMIDIVAAVSAHKSAGLLYLVYLRHPTTGGVFATWGSLGHITVAEPHALIGFLGPKVYEALHSEQFPEGVQSGENLFAHGLVDAVLEPRHLRGMLIRVLDTVTKQREPRSAGRTKTVTAQLQTSTNNDDPWTSVELSRLSTRPGLRTLLRFAATDVIGLNGTGMGERENASMVALARFGDHGVVIIGFDRHAQSFDGPLGPGALRQARRAMALASELSLPLVTIIDTPGAALSREAEEGGLGGEIARCLATMIDVPSPTVSVILGQGSGGAALAIFPADRVIAARHAWLSPLQPEGASVIRHGTIEKAATMARQQGISATDLYAAGLVDEIVDELPEAGIEDEAFCRRIGDAIERHVSAATELREGGPSPDQVRRHRVRNAVHRSVSRSHESQGAKHDPGH